MIRSVAITVLMLVCPAAFAQSEPEDSADRVVDEDALHPYRVEFEALAERAIGTASQPVAFNWRRTHLHVAGMIGYPLEFNTFNNVRFGGLLRRPVGGALLELGVSAALSYDTPSSRLIALTPYRQSGRPDRMEVDFGVALPVAEGMVTPRHRILPAVQLTFNLQANLRYRWYPGSQRGMRAGAVVGALFSPTLTTDEIDNLETARLNAMQVDPGRYELMLGVGNDLYLQQGLFIAPRFMVAIPLLAPVSQTDMLIWVDLSLNLGVAF